MRMKFIDFQQFAWVLLLGVLLLGGVARAADSKAPGEPDPDALPHHIVKGIVKGFTVRLRETRGKPREVKDKMIGELVDHHFARYLDMEYVTREIFGDYWPEIQERGLTLQAQATVREAIRQRYINALRNYDRQRIRIFKARVKTATETEGEEARVHVTVDAAIKTLPVDIYFHKDADGVWLIQDVKVLGTSVVEAGQAAVERGVKVLGLDAVLDKLNIDGEVEEPAEATS